MNKKIIIGGIGALCLAIGIGTVIIKTKEKKEVEKKPYLQEEYVQNEISKLDDGLDKNKKVGERNNVAGNKIWQDKYDFSKEAYFDLSEKEVIVTRDMGVEFINDVRPYTNKGGYKDKLEDMKKLTTEGLGNMLYEKLSGLQPALSEGFRKLEVKEVKPVQYERQEDGTLLWSFDTVEDIIDLNDKVVNTQQAEIKLLFAKVDGEWKIVDYIPRKY
ncbi:MAG: hypothetical protein E6682_02765 [Clostridium perfringens]|uniref:Lipoprotein n=1 Tax=Clostridium perfringens TaxID=1502 RepID=A0ABD4PPD0_CLOPF|nr:hypothetical protein [Clostridium perfringens]EGT3618129.1 hypothetical protein [Clostridium perfringens]EGT4141131.1 hypothetical protein [Clostridium perfringens]EHK2347334.1 hypothetical protein [Clostridium perfringens]MBO3397988.1 hypothetical protein [Clostridium perfringens]MBO3408667.1 hypothetical protein [Clostridium perfringens]